MPFTRVDAVHFADTHWNIPADDGLFWLSNQSVAIDQVRKANVLRQPGWKPAPAADGWQPFFVDDGNGGEKAVFRRGTGAAAEEILINPWEGIADCAHFLSRCLTAGGAKVAARGVSELVELLQARADTKTLCDQVTREGGQRIIDAGILKPGDMIGYFNVDPKGDYGGRKAYAHSTMYIGKINGSKDGGVTCHTICRYPGRSWVEDSWWLKPPGHYTYTFIHFSVDDPVPNPVKVAGLVGWWQLVYSGKTEYYFVDRNGIARYTKKAPESGHSAIQAVEGTAHWFMGTNGATTFVWKKSGTVEVWTPDGTGYRSLINGSVPGVLTKLVP